MVLTYKYFFRGNNWNLAPEELQRKTEILPELISALPHGIEIIFHRKDKVGESKMSLETGSSPKGFFMKEKVATIDSDHFFSFEIEGNQVDQVFKTIDEFVKAKANDGFVLEYSPEMNLKFEIKASEND